MKRIAATLLALAATSAQAIDLCSTEGVSLMIDGGVTIQQIDKICSPQNAPVPGSDIEKDLSSGLVGLHIEIDQPNKDGWATIRLTARNNSVTPINLMEVGIFAYDGNTQVGNGLTYIKNLSPGQTGIFKSGIDFVRPHWNRIEFSRQLDY